MAGVRALALVFAFVEQAKLPSHVSDRLAIVVEEWVLNVVEHGRPPTNGWIGVRLRRGVDSIRIFVSDPGLAFDPRTDLQGGPNPERGGGAGLALLRAWTRVASYRRRGDRNHLLLELPIEEA